MERTIRQDQRMHSEGFCTISRKEFFDFFFTNRQSVLCLVISWVSTDDG